MALERGINGTIGDTVGGSPVATSINSVYLVGAWPVDGGKGYSETLKKVSGYPDYKTKYVDEEEMGVLTRAAGWNAHKTAKYWLNDRGFDSIYVYNAFDPDVDKVAVSSEAVAFYEITSPAVTKLSLLSLSGYTAPENGLTYYSSLTYAGSVPTVTIYSNPSKTVSLCAGTGTATSPWTITLAEVASSGISGSVVVTGGTTSPADDEDSTISIYGYGSLAEEMAIQGEEDTGYTGIVIATKSYETDYTLTRALGVTKIYKETQSTDPYSASYSYMDPDISELRKKAAIDEIDNIPLQDGMSMTDFPNWIHTPGWTWKKVTAEAADSVQAIRAYLGTKCNKGLLGGYLGCRALYDIDMTAYEASLDVQDLYANKLTNSEYMRAYAGDGIKAGGETEQLLSDKAFAVQVSLTAANDNFPGETDSSKLIDDFVPNVKKLATSAYSQAVFKYGITTVSQMMDGTGWSSWGSYTSKVNGSPSAIDYAQRNNSMNDINMYIQRRVNIDMWIQMMDERLTLDRVNNFTRTWNSIGGQWVSSQKLAYFKMAVVSFDPDVEIKWSVTVTEYQTMNKGTFEIITDLTKVPDLS